MGDISGLLFGLGNTTSVNIPTSTGTPADIAILLFALIAAIIAAANAVAEKSTEPTLIYRTGSGNGRNLTPRSWDLGLSYTTEQPVRGPYTVVSMEEINATGTLIAVRDGLTHVSVVPVDYSEMPTWQASRPTANETPHVYTVLLQSISTRVRR